MTKSAADPQTRLYVIALFVLLVGMCSAAAIYFTAADDADLADAYRIVVVNGKTYPVAPGDSKAYVRDLQRFGGKTAVLFDEISRWFAGLWRGRALAMTVGWMSIALSAFLLLLAHLLPLRPFPPADSDELD
jgi:hypothetical protein